MREKFSHFIFSSLSIIVTVLCSAMLISFVFSIRCNLRGQFQPDFKLLFRGSRHALSTNVIVVEFFGFHFLFFVSLFDGCRSRDFQRKRTLKVCYFNQDGCGNFLSQFFFLSPPRCKFLEVPLIVGR